MNHNRKLVGINLISLLIVISSFNSIKANSLNSLNNVFFGFCYKVTPIDINKISIFQTQWIPRINYNGILAGPRVYFGYNLPINEKYKIEISQNLKYGTQFFEVKNLYTSVGNIEINKPIKMITTDINVNFKRTFGKNDNKYNINLGYSWLNLGSDCVYSINFGNQNIQTIIHDLSYQGPNLGFSVFNNGIEIGLNLNFISKVNHSFVFRGDMIIPELKIQYFLKPLSKK